MKTPVVSEHALHCAVARFLDVVIHPPFYWTSIDAGAGKMSPIAAAKRKARGVKRGIPDILVMGPGPNVLWIELKRKGGTLTPEQKAFAEAMHACQAWTVLCRSVEEVAGALEFVRMKRKDEKGWQSVGDVAKRVASKIKRAA